MITKTIAATIFSAVLTLTACGSASGDVESTDAASSTAASSHVDPGHDRPEDPTTPEYDACMDAALGSEDINGMAEALELCELLYGNDTGEVDPGYNRPAEPRAPEFEACQNAAFEQNELDTLPEALKACDDAADAEIASCDDRGGCPWSGGLR